MEESKIREVLNRVKQTLGLMKNSLDRLTNINDINQRRADIANVIIWGRAITFVVQNLRSAVGGKVFDSWYESYLTEMKSSELLKKFKDVRNELEKEGNLRTLGSGTIDHLDSKDIDYLNRIAPKNAVSIFLGDQLGGSGYNVKLSDGTIETVYVNFGDVANRMNFIVHLMSKPFLHLNNIIEDTSIENCCLLYYEYLMKIYNDAVFKFLMKG